MYLHEHLLLYAFWVLPFVSASNTFSFFLSVFYLVYDVTRRETFTNLIDIWAKEVELYSTNHDSIKILVGNKVDKVKDWNHRAYAIFFLILSDFEVIVCFGIGIELQFLFLSIVFLHFIVWILKTISCVIFQESERAVSKEEGMALAQQHRCLFLECSAKTRENVQQCFNDLSLKVYI